MNETRLKLWLLLILIALIAGPGMAGCVSQPSQASEPTPTFVRPAATPTATTAPRPGYQVKRGTIVETIQVAGRVAAAKEARLFFEVGGPIQRLDVAAGQAVEAGQVLAEIKSTELEEAISQAEYELDLAWLNLKKAETSAEGEGLLASDVQVEQMRLALEQAQSAYDQIRWLNTQESQEAAFDLEVARLDHEMAQIRYRIQQAGSTQREIEIEILEKRVGLARTELAKAQAQLGKTKLLAPFSGQVLALEVELYSWVEPYEVVLTIIDPSVLEIRAELDESAARRVGVGQRVRITLEATGGQEFVGWVRAVVSKPGGEKAKAEISYLLSVDFESPPDGLGIGMAARLEIETERRENVLLVPTRAIRTIGNKRYVFVEKEGKLLEVGVETGLSNPEYTEIVAGLEEGETIVVAP
jgi:RND family efflux transporter MFP subunit